MATVMTSGLFPTVSEPILCYNFDDAYNKLDSEWDKVFEVVKAPNKRWSEDAILVGFGLAQLKQEGAPVNYDRGGQGPRQQYWLNVYALAFAMTEEMFEDGEDESLGKMFARQLGKAMTETKELEHANIISLAGSSQQPMWDGLPLLSTAHPLFEGTNQYTGLPTYSNTLATPADFSETSVTALYNMTQKAVDLRGKPAGIKIKQAIIPVDLIQIALQVTKSPLTGILAGVNNVAQNYINVVANQNYIPQIQVVRRQTSTTQYLLQTDAERGFMHKWRAQVSRKSEGDFETGNSRFKARERYTAGITNPLCAFGDVGV